MVLYQGDVTGRPAEEMLHRWRSFKSELDPYATEVAEGVEGEREELDKRLGEASIGWAVERMSAVDRTILRLALYEIEHYEDVPVDVAVSEAVELAKGFSGEDSPSFVSGVLRAAADGGMGLHGS
jgi:N utilization substance protein B